ncbi:MAG: response regulator transcription factor [Ottowia sp.]|uniref:response regulator n=1 Tax=Ottowia sp. TaxID=1898956 RepID=UPI0039E3BD40
MIPPVRPAAASPPRLLVVDDHELVRLGLVTLIAAEAAGGPAPEVLEACSLAQALHLYSVHGEGIALVLLDLHLPDAHGLSGLRTFLARFPRAPVVVLSGSSDPALMREAVAAGARDFLSKSSQLDEVLAYVQGLGHCGAARPAPADGRLVQTLDGERLRLTQRQAELLDCLLTGQSNREIAERVHLAEGTVKNHVSALLLLFGVRSRAQLISRLR